MKGINKVKRKVMRGLTSGIGNRYNSSNGNKNNELVKRILVCRPNHRLGNLLLMTPLVDDLATIFPNAKVDLFMQGGLGTKIFEQFPNVDRVIQLPKKPFKNLSRYLKGWTQLKTRRYDIAINIVEISSSGRLSTKFANAAIKLFEIPKVEGFVKDAHAGKEPVTSFRKNAELLGFSINPDAPVPDMNIKLSESEKEEGRKALHAVTGNSKPAIGLFTTATGEKLYDKNWWDEFYKLITTRFPDYNFVELLPVDGESQLSGKAPTYFDRDIRKVAAFIAATRVFVAADSGVMHLSAASLAPTIGLFKVTDPVAYTPYNQGSASVDTRKQDITDIVERIDEALHV